MKKITAFLILLLTWYIAGKYRYISLMILAFTELVLFIVMLILPRITKHFLNINFDTENQTTHKNIPLLCTLKADNQNILPLNRLQVKMRFRYRNFPKSLKKQRLFCSVKYKATEKLQFQMQAPYCGLMQAELVSCRVYDGLALFSSEKKLRSNAQIAVLPPQRTLNIDFPAEHQSGGNNFGEHTVLKSGDNYDEILQVREYRNGDSMRIIHWNYSARTNELWVKEYSHEADKYIYLIADTSMQSHFSIENMDAFYEILSAIVQGLIQKKIPVCVYWHNTEKGGLQSIEITDSSQREEMLLHLYQAPFSEIPPTLSIRENVPVMRLNLNLEWLLDNHLIYCFSKTAFEKEINEYLFIL